VRTKKALPFIGLSVYLFVGGVSGQQRPDASIEEGYSTTGSGIQIHYLQSGQITSAHALVFVPGWRLPASLWNEQLRYFSRTTRVIAVDPRSQGASTKASDGNTPESRARDLHDVLASLGAAHSVLIGWSQGAQDVAAYLQEFGSSSVDGVVFVDSPVSFGPSEVDAHREFAKVILSGISMYSNNPQDYSEGYIRSIFKKPHPELDFPSLLRVTLQTPTNTGIAMLIADIFGVDRRPALAKLNKPSLVIASSVSPLLDVEKEMAASIPGSTLVVIEGAGHAVFVDEPQRFDEALGVFLQSLSQ
jgi:non-heme chloroperoxidase